MQGIICGPQLHAPPPFFYYIYVLICASHFFPRSACNFVSHFATVQCIWQAAQNSDFYFSKRAVTPFQQQAPSDRTSCSQRGVGGSDHIRGWCKRTDLSCQKLNKKNASLMTFFFSHASQVMEETPRLLRHCGPLTSWSTSTRHIRILKKTRTKSGFNITKL